MTETYYRGNKIWIEYSKFQNIYLGRWFKGHAYGQTADEAKRRCKEQIDAYIESL